MNSKNEGWVASLSNGETVFESGFKSEPGERTPWGQLTERCEVEGLWVTQLQYQKNGKTTVGLRKADGYAFFTDLRVDGILSRPESPRQQVRIGIGSVVGDTVYCTLINDQGQTWQDSRHISKMRLHCIMRPSKSVDN